MAALFVWCTLSVKSFGFARSPERGSWRTNVSLRGFGTLKASSKFYLQRHTFEESGAANAVSLYDPLREKAIQENPQIFLNCNYKNIFR